MESRIDRRRFLALGAAGLAGVAACASPERHLLEATDVGAIELGPRPTGAPLPSGPVETTVTTAPTTTAVPWWEDIPEDDRVGVSFVARASGARTPVYATPDDAEPSWVFDNPIASGGPLVFLVRDPDDEPRHHVLLPVRPNGTTGWVDAGAVTLEYHNYAMLVELSAFRFTLFDHGASRFSTEVGVARDNAPTPDGVYYTTELLRPPRPTTAYGAYAYGLSGYSETFEQFAGGPGQLGLHGTNDPSSIGTQASSGCIRMTNEDITFLVEEIRLPVGVPVEVRA